MHWQRLQQRQPFVKVSDSESSKQKFQNSLGASQFGKRTPAWCRAQSHFKKWTDQAKCFFSSAPTDSACTQVERGPQLSLAYVRQ